MACRRLGAGSDFMDSDSLLKTVGHDKREDEKRGFDGSLAGVPVISDWRRMHERSWRKPPAAKGLRPLKSYNDAMVLQCKPTT